MRHGEKRGGSSRKSVLNITSTQLEKGEEHGRVEKEGGSGFRCQGGLDGDLITVGSGNTIPT